MSGVECGGEKAIKNEVREVTGSLIIQDLLKGHYKDFGFYSEKNRFDQRSNMNNLHF